MAAQTGAWLGVVSVWVEVVVLVVVEEEVAGCAEGQDRCWLWGVRTRLGGERGWLESLGGLLFYCRQVKCPTSCQAVWLIHCPGIYGMGVHLEGRCYVG